MNLISSSWYFMCVCALVTLSLLPQRHNRAISEAHTRHRPNHYRSIPHYHISARHYLDSVQSETYCWPTCALKTTSISHTNTTSTRPKQLTLIYPTIYTVVLTFSPSAGCHVPQKVSHQSASAVNPLNRLLMRRLLILPKSCNLYLYRSLYW